jgi:hypothetical protein
MAPASRLFDGRVETLQEVPPIRQAGQAVEVRQLSEVLEGLLFLGDILNGSH